MDAGFKPGKDIALPGNRELGKIPFNIAGERGFGAGKNNIQRMAAEAIHLEYFEKREANLVSTGIKNLIAEQCTSG